jgi:hypothetical protein
MNSTKSTSFGGGNWIWHPEWKEGADESSAGGFVHFRKSITIETLPKDPVSIHITADTKYKLYINSKLVFIGPVKGDEHLWFYDNVDIQPYLRLGTNYLAVRVLRFYYATPYATSFPRLPCAGLLIRNVDHSNILGRYAESNESWETALDFSTRLRVDVKEDEFLHIYENVNNPACACVNLKWLPAENLHFPKTHGLSAPWKLSPRMIPLPRYQNQRIKAVHNVQSTISKLAWEKFLLGLDAGNSEGINCLPAGTSHHIELEVEHHMTAFLDFRFQRPRHIGSTMRVTYSECYEDEPEMVPYIRIKNQRCDKTKKLIGPEDIYAFGGVACERVVVDLKYYESVDEEIFTPFHFRTFRFITLDIEVGQNADLIMKGIDIMTTCYPLEVIADFSPASTQNDSISTRELWTTSIRTLSNCMHDCYEDCPFYEQLQYGMDARSSALFTYCISADDRMARQAIMQLHNSYRPSLGLTASRAPAHQYQIIPHFSLFWVCMIVDHFENFSDLEFVRQFLPTCDGIFQSFSRHIDPSLGLICTSNSSTQWEFVDWVELWKPMGIPPAAGRTGVLSYTNMLYAYTLKRAANLLVATSRAALATEYSSRAEEIVHAIKTHCFDGRFFTDGLAIVSDTDKDLSQHSQVWAVLCGAAEGERAHEVLSQSLLSQKFTQTSLAMSFYTLRALSMAGGDLYDRFFHGFWEPWRMQLSQGLTTWVEDNVSQRSDCHAWGSTPLYEYLVEVAGIRPAEPGWAAIAFKPRIGLFQNLDAKIPFQRNSRSGIAHVKWKSDGCHTKLFLSLRMTPDEHIHQVPVQVILPDGEIKIMDGSKDIVLSIKSDKAY